jgi:hypothetical protein
MEDGRVTGIVGRNARGGAVARGPSRLRPRSGSTPDRRL